MKYWLILGILLFIVCYVIANRQTLILEHLDATSGPMDGKKAPVPAASSVEKCYGTPVDFSSGKFLSFDNVVNQARSLDKLGDMNNLAKNAKTTQTLSGAQKVCSSNPKCTGIIYWDGTCLHPEWQGPIKQRTEEMHAPLKGYTPYSGDPSLTSIIDGNPGGFTKDSQLPPAGILTFTPVSKCPSPSNENSDASGDGDVAALTSKLTALQQEVDNMKNQAKAQGEQAEAVKASLQAIK